MARIVTGPSDQILLSNPQYGLAMKLAFDSGWKPQGTLPPPEWEWLPQSKRPTGETRPWPAMNYFAGLGERVTDEDADALASTLESKLDDIPNHDAFSHKVAVRINLPFTEYLAALKPGEQLNYFEFFSGPNKAILKRFIDLGKAGGFAITGAGTP
jgi:hypothetical protein